MSVPAPRDFLHTLFKAATDAALPSGCVPPHLPPKPNGRTVVVGAGKAAAAMARAVEDHWDGPLEGAVVTRYGHGVPTRSIAVLEASHPVPDAAGVAASGRILETVSGLSEDDLVICLISGGGSALLSLPAPGLTLAGKAALTGQLLRSGATIAEMNCVRKHLSAIKGGRLAAACHPARVVALVISDVPGDDLSIIASGATVADPSTTADAQAVLERYGITLPDGVDLSESPKPGDPRLARVENILVATPQMSLDAAARVAGDAGYVVEMLSDRVEGEARDVARAHAVLARKVAEAGKPTVILSGGEVTVTLGDADGRGGPNAEFALALAVELQGHAGIHAIACDTDGIDGSEDNAGAQVAPDTLARGRALGLDAESFLANHDAYTYFERIGDLVVSGPTLTNVNDFRAIVFEG